MPPPLREAFLNSLRLPVAAVSSTGVVWGISPGEATISATYQNPDGSIVRGQSSATILQPATLPDSSEGN